MSLNASKRNVMQRPPSSRMMDKSRVKNTSNATVADQCKGNKNSMPKPQILSQKTSGMPPPGRVTKQVRNPIPIRHTLTSKLRMEKANPLLTSGCSGISEPAITGTPSRRSTFHLGMLQPKQKPEFRSNVPASEIRPLKKRAFVNEKKTDISILKENKPPVTGLRGKVSMANTKFGKVIPNQSRISSVNKALPTSLPKNNSSSSQNRSSAGASNQSLRRSTWNKSMPLTAHNVTSTAQGTNASVKIKQMNDTKRKATDSKKPERKPVVLSSQRSVSKKLGTPAKKQLKSILRKSASVGDLRKTNIKSEDPGVLSEIENKPESKALNKSLKSVAFYSPLHNASFTPVNTVNTPPPSVLRKRLEDWLAKRGKSSLSYRHLCCFGLPKNMPMVPPKMNYSRESGYGKAVCDAQDDNDSEPRLNETITLEPSNNCDNYENNHEVDIENSAPKGSSTPEHAPEFCDENKENAASLFHPGALDDLRKLVHSGYPRDQCEHWLSLISKTHPTVKEMPQYWGCLAALEEARGDFSSAVDCYGRAIVKGADADDVDERLDDLWEKFCTLSVNSVENKRTPTKKLAIDTKQIFKSTVIKFALQQKAVKRSINSTEGSMQNVNYIVTPVRRSSRRSASRFRTTPTVKCVDKLEDLEQDIRETMEFHGNAVLNPGN